jgi:queuine tRNA-ribosyltransferase
MSFSFEIQHRASDCAARSGLLKLRGIEIPTPAFMPIGTRGVVKTVSPEEIWNIGYRLILSNSYHLYLRPGHKLLEDFGGLRKFMNWPGAILTDSGGFQVFSLAKLRKITDEGVLFQSHIDGSSHLLTPELCMEVQESIGSDIIMCLDDVRGYPCSREEALDALERTTRWARRCAASKKRVDPALFAIVQGSMYRDLRRLSVQGLADLNFDGYAIGGLSVGEPRDMMVEMIDETCPMLPDHAPRYVMGIGKPLDIVDAVIRGVDLFDCVLPTRNARNSMLFTSLGPLNIKNARHRNDPNPVDPNCNCPLCADYSRAYLRHLFQEKEVFGLRLATLHNLVFYFELLRKIRRAIAENNLLALANEYSAATEENND